MGRPQEIVRARRRHLRSRRRGRQARQAAGAPPPGAPNTCAAPAKQLGDPGGARCQIRSCFLWFLSTARGGADEAASLRSERTQEDSSVLKSRRGSQLANAGNELCGTLGANATLFLPFSRARLLRTTYQCARL